MLLTTAAVFCRRPEQICPMAGTISVTGLKISGRATIFAAATLATGIANVYSRTPALLAQAISLSGDVAIHFDPQALFAGAECNAAPESPVQ